MTTTPSAHFATAAPVEMSRQRSPKHPLVANAKLFNAVQLAIQRSTHWLLAQQHEEGYWCGELQGDTILESEYILLLTWLGREGSLSARKAAAYILQQQLTAGGWAQYPGGDVDISGSVKAYFALKLTGHDPRAEHMQRARRAIIAHGGADAVNSFTRFYLALLGQISYDHCPAVPPEALLLPDWCPLNIYRISAWSRTLLVPLSIMWAYRPSRRLPTEMGIGELFVRRPENWPPLRSPGTPANSGWWTWERFFRAVDRTVKWCERRRIRPLRQWALKAAERWIIERLADGDGLGAIFPPIIWSVVALKCLGHDDRTRLVQDCLDQLQALILEDEDTIRLQPCKSPVWDTAIALRALAAAGVASQGPSTWRAVFWLLSKEVRRCGDWAKKVNANPGGWFFEHRNEFYPDVDDTAMVLLALSEQFVERCGNGKTKGHGDREAGSTDDTEVRVAAAKVNNFDKTRPLLPALSLALPLPISFSRIAHACERGRCWLLAMQNRDGGWGAFDKDNDCEMLCHVPFADHNAMIDPSTPDLTGRVLESLAHGGMTIGDPQVDRAVRYLRGTQEPDGSWYGRWGVNYIYGTWQVLVGLTEVGLPHNDSAIQRGAQWLLAHQQPSGGWGESANSYIFPALRGQGPTTASQTSWAVLGLIAAGLREHPAVQRGIRYLLDSQQQDGRWDEMEFTGTGFPRVFYLRYHLYPMYFPLLALAKWQTQVPGYPAPDPVSPEARFCKSSGTG